MSQSKFFFEHFSRYKAEGLEDYRARRMRDARFKLFKAAQFLYKLANVTEEGRIKKERIANAIKLSTLAKSIDPGKKREKHRPEADETGSDTKFQVAEKPGLTFDDIAGLEDVKEQIRLKMIYPFTHPEKAKKFGIPIGGGVLLYGPPGTGKTMMAKAIAGEIDAAFFTVKPSEVMSKWVGEAEQNIEALFREARKHERAIVFIDEIEALIPRRATTKSSVMARMVPQILAELEGFDSPDKSSILFIGATNEPWSLDPAVLRPGRFDEIIYVGLPDFYSRKKILEINLAHRPLADDVDIDELSAMLEGFSGADIRNICRKAAGEKFLDAVEKDIDEPIGREDIEAIIKAAKPSVKPKELKRFLEYGDS